MYKDKMGRVYDRWFDKYGEPLFKPNTAATNRRTLELHRTRPSNRPKGGYRPRKKIPA